MPVSVLTTMLDHRWLRWSAAPDYAAAHVLQDDVPCCQHQMQHGLEPHKSGIAAQRSSLPMQSIVVPAAHVGAAMQAWQLRSGRHAQACDKAATGSGLLPSVQGSSCHTPLQCCHLPPLFPSMQ